eukprot:COSAG06_NODE_18640_length_876_cov_1.021879_1_plen_68_part_10
MQSRYSKKRRFWQAVELRDLDIKHPDAVAVRKTASFFEFSLCMSRACLGKMIVFIYKWLKNAVFRRPF